DEHNVLKNRDLRINIDKNNDEPVTKETRIIELMKENPKISVDELANAISVSPRTIKSVIAILIKENKIRRVNGKRYGYWEVI
ncbi:MAG: HTH domain-containing protein, partial [Bacilli bacterium]|nr:HTH domain-containing protein [Bacilli bacterium]